jgi:hypothetical protein
VEELSLDIEDKVGCDCKGQEANGNYVCREKIVANYEGHKKWHKR